MWDCAFENDPGPDRPQAERRHKPARHSAESTYGGTAIRRQWSCRPPNDVNTSSRSAGSHRRLDCPRSPSPCGCRARTIRDRGPDCTLRWLCIARPACASARACASPANSPAAVPAPVCVRSCRARRTTAARWRCGSRSRHRARPSRRPCAPCARQCWTCRWSPRPSSPRCRRAEARSGTRDRDGPSGPRAARPAAPWSRAVAWCRNATAACARARPFRSCWWTARADRQGAWRSSWCRQSRASRGRWRPCRALRSDPEVTPERCLCTACVSIDRFAGILGALESRRSLNARMCTRPGPSCIGPECGRGPRSPHHRSQSSHPRSGAVRNSSGSGCVSSNTAAVSGPPITAAVSRLTRRLRRSGMPVRSGVWPCTMKRPQSTRSQSVRNGSRIHTITSSSCWSSGLVRSTPACTKKRSPSSWQNGRARSQARWASSMRPWVRR